MLRVQAPDVTFLFLACRAFNRARSSALHFAMKEPTPRSTLSIHTSQPFASACIVALGCQTPYGRLPGIATTTALADLPCVYLLSHLSKPPPSTALEAFGRPSGGWRTRALASVYGSSSLYSRYLSSRGQGGTKAGDPFASSSESQCNVVIR